MSVRDGDELPTQPDVPAAVLRLPAWCGDTFHEPPALEPDVRAGDAAGIAAATGVRAKPKRLIDLSTQVLESERAHELLDARGYGSVRANVRTAAPAQAACATFNPLPIVTEEGGAAFTTLPVPPELAGNGKDADGDVVIEPPVIDDASDGDGEAGAPEESAEERARRLDRERKKRKREEQTALAAAALQKEQECEEPTEPERQALAARRAETARGAARRRAGNADD